MVGQPASAAIAQLWDRVDNARASEDDEAELSAYRAALDHPCAHHLVVEHEVLDEIHRVLRRLGRYDEAIEAKREAIEAGYRSAPDPEADIAECLVEAGRRAEADALYAELRRRDPDDVWLYNSAGWAYGRVDDREALRWLHDGIEVALRTGDHDRVAGQLLEMSVCCWDRLGEPHDADLAARVEAFQKDWVRPPYRPNTSMSSPLPERRTNRCDHCGFEQDRPPVSTGGSGWSVPRAEQSRVVLSLAWFAADEWTEAVQRWPHLTEDLPAAHEDYTRGIEARMKWLAHLSPGQQLAIAPLSVDELVEHERDQAGTGEARSRFAAEMARTGRALHWPPARNEPCWCGSGRKYKRCCGPVARPGDDAR